MDRPATRYEFGSFQLDTEARRLLKEGTPVPLPPKTFDLLLVLIESRGRALGKSELLEMLWPDTTVEESNLVFQIFTLRKALGREVGSWIETVSRHGYRFTAPVVVCPAVQAPVLPSVPSRMAPPEAPSGPPSRFFPRAVLGIAALAVALATVLLLTRDRLRSQDLRPVPLTTFLGFESNPALSPDGNHVAFTWNGEKQDNLDIYVVAISLGVPVRITTNAAEDLSPAWSPDGRTIAFLRRLSDEQVHLYAVPAAGGPEHKIAEIREQPWFSRRRPGAIAWSPDGLWIAASHREPDDPFEGIYLFSLTGQKRRLTMPPPGFRSDIMPAISRDGRALAFCRLPSPAVSEIHLLSLSANLEPLGEPRRLTDYKGWSVQPVWTVDGRSLLHLYADDFGKGREIRRISATSTPVRSERIPINEEVSEIALGRHLVYSRRVEDTNIWRAELPNSGRPPVEAELLIASTRMDHTPRYSPDGGRIAFISWRSGSREVWVSKADGSNQARLTFFNGPLVGQPHWSPDGQWITFHARVERTLEIFAMPAAGGPPKRLTTNSWDDSQPSYSRDGRSIFFCSRRSGSSEMHIWRMSTDGSDTVQITSSGGTSMPVESPDRKMVFFSRYKGPGEIWSVPVQGGEAVRVTGPMQAFPSGFAVTAEGAYYGAPPHVGERRFIRFFSFSTGRSHPVIANKRPVHAMSVSPDGKYIVFDQYEESAGDLMLVHDFDAPER